MVSEKICFIYKTVFQIPQLLWSDLKTLKGRYIQVTERKHTTRRRTISTQTKNYFGQTTVPLHMAKYCTTTTASHVYPYFFAIPSSFLCCFIPFMCHILIQKNFTANKTAMYIMQRKVHTHRSQPTHTRVFLRAKRVKSTHPSVRPFFRLSVHQHAKTARSASYHKLMQQ